MGEVDAVEWACALCGHRIQNDWAHEESIKCASDFALTLNILPWKLRMIQKSAATSNWWLAASSWQHAHSCIMSHEEFFSKISNHPGDSGPLQPRFGTLRFLAFPKTKITFKRKEVSDCWWDSGKYDGAADGNWENCMRSQSAYFEGDWGIIVLCTMFLISSSINVSIFHITWLDTCWTEPTHLKN